MCHVVYLAWRKRRRARSRVSIPFAQSVGQTAHHTHFPHYARYRQEKTERSVFIRLALVRQYGMTSAEERPRPR